MKHLLSGGKFSELAAFFGRNIVAEQQNWLCWLQVRHFPIQLRGARAWRSQEASLV